METWKSCVGYENFYEVSDMGRVRSLQRPVKTPLGISMRGGVVLKKSIANTGYEVVNFTMGPNSRRQEHVHRLVLTAFVGPCPKTLEACHDDGVRSNNALENLRWDTRKANHQDKKRHGTYQEGPKANNIKLTAEQVKEVFLSKKSQRQISKEFGIAKTTVARIKHQERWSCVTNEIKN